MRKVNMSEVEVVVIDEVGISIKKTLNMKEEKARLENEEKTIQDQSTTNPKYNVIIVKSLSIILQNESFKYHS